eukprot:CAMPEP_0201275848 /NCGR_PEP_ID=MMETSP0853-20130426/54123_1 /ASSEMBLY_ACC=CAM_ASM_000640 /TAXON_ID=183588 /ORGANISM="Pseudo-nitzschia fraudulenta, Strain WWA7" /LENGTH=55 /DNA_ID=CAMNT_0047583599 /DNA_START=570 /DNA_END=737 /DNA_ORIENTATION=-
MAPCLPERRINEVLTMSLSATGSKKAPKAVEISQRLAKKPSSQSVTLANAKMVPV